MRLRNASIMGLWAALAAIVTLIVGPLSPVHAHATMATSDHAVAGSMAGGSMADGSMIVEHGSLSPLPCEKAGIDACAWTCLSACQLLPVASPAVAGPRQFSQRTVYQRAVETLRGVLPEGDTPPPR